MATRRHHRRCRTERSIVFARLPQYEAHLIGLRGSFGPREFAAETTSRSVHPFCKTHQGAQQTHRPTLRQTLVEIGRIYAMHAMRPKLNLLLLLSWHAPLGVRSAVRRHQPPRRTVLGQVDCFIQCEVVGSQIALDGVQPRDTKTPRWSLPVIWWEAVRITLASASSSVRAICPNMERRRDCIIAVRLGCLVILLTSLL